MGMVSVVRIHRKSCVFINNTKFAFGEHTRDYLLLYQIDTIVSLPTKMCIFTKSSIISERCIFIVSCTCLCNTFIHFTLFTRNKKNSNINIIIN